MMVTDTPLKTFLELPYDKLEEMNLSLQKKAESTTVKEIQKENIAYLNKETKIKAITVCFTDIEGRFHMLDYDKKFFLDSLEILTFDGSSIKGFSAQHESDLRLSIDWGSLRFLPADVFGPGKVVVFASVLDRSRKPYISDFRGQLKLYTEELLKKQGKCQWDD